MESISDWMGVDIEPSVRAKLEAATQAQRKYERPLAHSLEEWGLTREEIYRELEPIFREFGWKR